MWAAMWGDRSGSESRRSGYHFRMAADTGIADSSSPGNSSCQFQVCSDIVALVQTIAAHIARLTDSTASKGSDKLVSLGLLAGSRSGPVAGRCSTESNSNTHSRCTPFRLIEVRSISTLDSHVEARSSGACHLGSPRAIQPRAFGHLRYIRRHCFRVNQSSRHHQIESPSTREIWLRVRRNLAVGSRCSRQVPKAWATIGHKGECKIYVR